MKKLSATHGLRGHIKSIVQAMHAMRSAPLTPQDVSLREYLGSGRYSSPGSDDTKLKIDLEAFFHELGITQSGTTLDELMSSEDTAWLAPEIIREGIKRGMGLAQREQAELVRRAIVSQAITGEQTGGKAWISPQIFLDPIMRGAIQRVFYPDLVIREITVGQPTVTMPLLQLSDAGLTDSAEAATIEEGTVTYGDKTITLKKKARGLKFTYESIRFNNLDLVALYFEDLGRILGASLNGLAVLALVNGDQVDGSEAPAVIGVEDVPTGFQWKDIARIWVQLSLLGRMSTSIIGNATTALDYLDLPEVKNKNQYGTALLQTTLKTPLPTEQDLYVSTKVPADELVFEDSSAALIQLTAWPLLLENEKIVSKQIEAAYASIYTGFANFQRNARVVLDRTLTFAAHPFPSWMVPDEE